MIRPVALVTAGLLLFACSEPPRTADIAPLPRLDLSRFEPGLQRRLAAAIDTLPAGQVEMNPVDAGRWFDAGRLLQAHGIEDLALDCYRTALQLQPDHVGAHYLAAYLEQQAGNLEAAAAGFELAATLDEKAVTPLIRLGEIHLQRGETDAAETTFLAAGDRAPGLPAISSGLGRAALAGQDYESARDHLETTLRAAPDADQLHYPLALAYRGLGDLDRARAHLARRGSRQAAIPDPWLGQVQALAATSQTHIKAGLAAYERGDLAAAAAEYRLALEQNPGLGDTHLALAWVLEQSGDPDGARHHAETALALGYDPAMAHYQLGRLFERAGDDAGAAAAYRRSVEASDATPPRELLAGVLMRQGDYAAAAEHYRQLSGREPDTARYHYLHGLALLAAGDCATAAAALTRARRLSPGSAEVAEAWIRTHSSCHPGDKREVAALAAELFSAIPEAAFAEAYAMALASSGRFDRAAQLQQRVAASAGSEFSRELLRRFRAGQPAREPWPAGAGVFAPPRLND